MYRRLGIKMHTSHTLRSVADEENREQNCLATSVVRASMVTLVRLARAFLTQWFDFMIKVAGVVHAFATSKVETIQATENVPEHTPERTHDGNVRKDAPVTMKLRALLRTHRTPLQELPAIGDLASLLLKPLPFQLGGGRRQQYQRSV